jgi:hypothetical protein
MTARTGKLLELYGAEVLTQASLPFSRAAFTTPARSRYVAKKRVAQPPSRFPSFSRSGRMCRTAKSPRTI